MALPLPVMLISPLSWQALPPQRAVAPAHSTLLRAALRMDSSNGEGGSRLKELRQQAEARPVSYTHLTLPTIYSV